MLPSETVGSRRQTPKASSGSSLNASDRVVRPGARIGAPIGVARSGPALPPRAAGPASGPRGEHVWRQRSSRLSGRSSCSAFRRSKVPSGNLEPHVCAGHRRASRRSGSLRPVATASGPCVSARAARVGQRSSRLSGRSIVQRDREIEVLRKIFVAARVVTGVHGRGSGPATSNLQRFGTAPTFSLRRRDRRAPASLYENLTTVAHRACDHTVDARSKSQRSTERDDARCAG